MPDFADPFNDSDKSKVLEVGTLITKYGTQISYPLAPGFAVSYDANSILSPTFKRWSTVDVHKLSWAPPVESKVQSPPISWAVFLIIIKEVPAVESPIAVVPPFEEVNLILVAVASLGSLDNTQ